MLTKIVNLKRRTDRKEHVDKTYPKLDFINYEIICACDPKYLKNNTIEINKLLLFILEFFFKNNQNISSLKIGELGCIVSHLYMWKNMIDNNIDKVLVLEDDITNFSPNYSKILEEINLISVNDYDIIYINSNGFSNNKTYITENIYFEEHNKGLARGWPGTFGYVLSKNGAEFLWNNYFKSKKNKRITGIDLYIYEEFYKKSKKLHYTKTNLVTTVTIENTVSSSDTQNEKDYVSIKYYEDLVKKLKIV